MDSIELDNIMVRAHLPKNPAFVVLGARPLPPRSTQ